MTESVKATMERVFKNYNPDKKTLSFFSKFRKVNEMPVEKLSKRQREKRDRWRDYLVDHEEKRCEYYRWHDIQRTKELADLIRKNWKND